MSTRSNIGVLNADGTVQAVYCHFDGYPTGVGAVLQKHYNDDAKARKLVSMGGISTIGPEIGESNPFPEKGDDRDCCFYTRDRGEELEIGVHESAKAYMERFDVFIEYRYLWDGKRWLCCGVPYPEGSAAKPVLPIEEAIAADK